MDDVKLIELIRDNPCVYNFQHPLYKDTNVRENVWKEISKELQLSAEECKNRWKNIRDTYMRRVKKLHTGSAKKLRKWHLADRLQFMEVVGWERETVTNATLEVDDPLQETDVQDSDSVDLAVGRSDPEIHDPEDVQNKLGEEHEQDDEDGVPDQSKKLKLSGESSTKMCKKNSAERSKLNPNIFTEPKEDHPIDTFFQSMALSVKRLSPINQIRAKMDICQIVSQLEMEELS